jgi:hypothetical protein
VRSTHAGALFARLIALPPPPSLGVWFRAKPETTLVRSPSALAGFGRIRRAPERRLPPCGDPGTGS